MKTLLFILLTSSLIGALIDKVINNSEKYKIRKKLITFLGEVKRRTIPSIHKIAIFRFTSLFKRSLIKNLILILTLSWISTTVMYNIDISNSRQPDRWHDYLPVYDYYVLNFIFDWITLFFIIKILSYSLNKNYFVGLICYCLSIIVSIYLYLTCYFITIYVTKYTRMFDNYLGISEYLYSEDYILKKKFFDGHPIKFDSVSANILENKGLISVSLFKSRSFSDSATIRMDVSEFNSWKTKLPTYLPSNILKFIFTDSITIESKPYNINIQIRDKNYSYEYTSKMTGILYSNTAKLASLSVFFPLLIFNVLLLFFILLKITTIISQSILYRFIHNTIYSRKAIEEFNPGIQIGGTIGIIASLIKLFFDYLTGKTL